MCFPEASTELVKGSGGAFEVTVEGNLVYSKLATGRFPAYQEIPMLLG
ncbi:MAG: selT/selW/selH-like putative selenoprotein [Planctomycetota bacterium]|jgi:selT/selW/selH-like putative selenoprotein